MVKYDFFYKNYNLHQIFRNLFFVRHGTGLTREEVWITGVSRTDGHGLNPRMPQGKINNLCVWQFLICCSSSLLHRGSDDTMS